MDNRTGIRKSPHPRALLLLLLMLPASGCAPARPPAQARLPVSVATARPAVADMVLVLQDGFFRAVTGIGVEQTGERTVETTDGRLRFTWSQGASFADGSGRFELALDGYAIPASSPYSAASSGYVTTGELVLDTRLSDNRFSVISVRLAHAERDRFPVERVESVITPGPYGMVPATIYVRVDGKTFRARQLYPQQ